MYGDVNPIEFRTSENRENDRVRHRERETVGERNDRVRIPEGRKGSVVTKELGRKRERRVARLCGAETKKRRAAPFSFFVCVCFV